MKNEKLCLIGCGWLGFELAKHLIAADYQVLATTTHDGGNQFALEGISYLSFDLERLGPIPEKMMTADIIIYMIPPLDPPVIKFFFDQLPVNKRIIFTSSTSVYGKNLGFVNESLIPDINHTNSVKLLQTEEYLLSRFKNLVIIRPGGLYGDKRHPIYFLQGRTNLTSGKELLHLVHREDCIKGILSILKENIWGEIFNFISDLRVPKKDYYTFIAKKLNLSPPEYINDEKSISATNISNEKSKIKLKINYLDPNQF